MTTPNLARGPRWGNTGKSDPLGRYLAPRLGLKPLSVEALLRGPQAINLRVAAIITAFRALGDDERLARFWGPMARAYEQREAPPLVDATWHLAQQADAGEDVDELAYQLDPSDAKLDRLIRAKDRAILREVALRDALVAEQQRRRGAR